MRCYDTGGCRGDLKVLLKAAEDWRLSAGMREGGVGVGGAEDGVSG